MRGVELGIEKARELLLAGKADDAVLSLQSETGLSAGIVSFGLTVDGFVEKWISEALSDVTTSGTPSNVVELVREELWRCLGKRYGDWDVGILRAFALHVSGVSAIEASKRLGVDPKQLQQISAEKGFHAERKWILNQIGLIVSDYLTVDVKVESQLRPIVKKLGRKALDGLDGDELTVKESLKAFQELGRLLAQVTGELVEKKQIDIGPTEQFMKILEAAEKMPRSVIELKEYKLIE